MNSNTNSLHWSVTLIISMLLSIGTWNPTEYNFINYVMHTENILSGFQPFFILVVVVLWILAIKSMFQSLKFYGVIITVILIGAFVIGLAQTNIIDFQNLTQTGWITTISVGFIIWLGLNASIFWKKLTGVYSTDDIEE